MMIPTEPIGCFPRPPELIAALSARAAGAAGGLAEHGLDALYEAAGQTRRMPRLMRIETPEPVRDRVLQAAEYIPLSQPGTTGDCGLAPFCDDNSASRDTAFAEIRARAEGTALAAAILKDRP